MKKIVLTRHEWIQALKDADTTEEQKEILQENKTQELPENIQKI